MTKFLAGFAYGRRVDDRHVRRRIRHQHRVEQRFIARLQIAKDQVFQQIILEARDFCVSTRNLQLDCGDSWRQQTFKAIFAPLHFGKGCPLVKPRVTQTPITRMQGVARVGHRGLHEQLWGISRGDDGAVAHANRAQPSSVSCLRSRAPG